MKSGTKSQFKVFRLEGGLLYSPNWHQVMDLRKVQIPIYSSRSDQVYQQCG